MLSVIIISYNTKELTLKCIRRVLESVKYSKINRYEIIVIDNNSFDETVRAIRNKFPKVKVIVNNKNFGFSKANNIGYRNSKGSILLFLNSDCFLQKYTLKYMIDSFQHNKHIGVVGPKLINLNGSLQFSAGYLPTPIKVFMYMSCIDDIPYINLFLNPYHADHKLFYEKDRYFDWVCGACFMVKREAFEEAGLFDENIFMYTEEMDLCRRIKDKGYLVKYLSCPEAEHIHGGSISSENRYDSLYKEFSNLIYIYKKYYGKTELFLLRIFLKMGALLRILLFGIIFRNEKLKKAYEKAYKLAGQ